MILIRTTNIESARRLREDPEYGALSSAVRQSASYSMELVACNAVRLGNVDHRPNHVFLFNYFYANNSADLIPVFEYTAGWFQAKTDLPKSVLLKSLEGETADNGIINHASWPNFRVFLPSLFLRPTFRTTFDIWEPFWPQHADEWPGVNAATKYVASNTRTSSKWRPSVFLNGDIPAQVANLKQQPGPDLHVWGSGNLLQTLMKHDLVDTFWLMIYPVTLGGGKRLFGDGTIPAAFKVTESTVGSTGVIVVRYERVGAITTGS